MVQYAEYKEKTSVKFKVEESYSATLIGPRSKRSLRELEVE